MSKGSKKIPRGQTRSRLIAENPGIQERIDGLLIEAEGTNLIPPCLVMRNRGKRGEYDWAKDPKGVYRQLQIKRGGKWVWDYAHRLVFILHYGGIAKGYEVCHLCHNRSCANREHLWSATTNIHRGKNGLDHRFRKFYQPIIEAATGKMIVQTVKSTGYDVQRLETVDLDQRRSGQPDRENSNYIGFYETDSGKPDGDNSDLERTGFDIFISD